MRDSNHIYVGRNQVGFSISIEFCAMYIFDERCGVGALGLCAGWWCEYYYIAIIIILIHRHNLTAHVFVVVSTEHVCACREIRT